MAIEINAEQFGMRQEFKTLEEAQQAIRDCGPEFANVELETFGDEVCLLDGERVGTVWDRPAIQY